MSRSVISRLRDIVPIRPLHRQEALQIAERQAQLLLDLLGVTDMPVNLQPVMELPRINVRFIRPFPVSGATHWTQGQWSVVLNAAEPVTRQRFSLAHELKHILDHRFIDVIYSGEKHKDERHRWIEQVCDYFAGCVLIPRPMLKRLWASGEQDLTHLARRFDVSRAAISTRLSQTGLVDRAPRQAHRHDALSGSYFRRSRRRAREVTT